MTREHKIIWSEGMFLQAQHFQQHDRYLEKLVESRMAPAMPHGWGFARLALDESSLSLGKLALSSASGVFPDGTPFHFPDMHAGPLPVNVPDDAKSQLIMLAVSLRRPDAREAVFNGGEESGLERYSLVQAEVRDNITDAPAQIQMGQLRMRLMLESEATDAFATMGVARLVERRPDNTLVLDRNYIPPSLKVNESPMLASHAREIAGKLHLRGEQLARLIAQPGRGGIGEISDFLLLQVVNRYEPLFMHYTRSDALHPEQLFVSCLQLAGDLSTICRDTHRVAIYPDYLHDNPERSFTPLLADLIQLLNVVPDRGAVPIPLQDRKDGIRVAVINDHDLLKTASFVLAVNARLPAETVRAGFPAKVAIGPPERIRELVRYQLPGVALHSMPVAPRQIPFHAGFNYFELDRGSELWDQLVRSGCLAMHIAGDFPGLELELWGIKGSS